MKNDYEIVGNDVIIELSQGECIIDLADLEFVDNEIPNRIYVGSAKNGKPYAYYQKKVNGKRTSIKLHQLLMGTFGCGRGGDVVVDHIDGDSLNNRRDNLQITTQLANVRKASVMKTNKLGVKHIRFRKDKKKYEFQLQRVGKTKHIGYFDTLEEAIMFRDKYLKNEEIPRPKEVTQ